MNKKIIKTIAFFLFGALFFTSCSDINDVINGEDEHIHSYAGVRYDSTTHTYYCECGESITFEHTFRKEVVSEPTCTQRGQITYTCICGYSYSEYVDSLGHNKGSATIENRVEASCANEGSYDEVYYCTICHEELERIHHTLEKLPHVQGSVVVENETNSTCQVHGHYDEVTYCSVCGEELSRVTKEKELAAHTLTHVERLEPTEESEGHVEHWICSVCNKYFSDANGNNEISPESVVLGKLTATKSVAELIALANQLEAGATSTEKYVSVGLVGKMYGTSTYYLLNGRDYIQLYLYNFDYSPYVGKIVKATGNLQNYKGTTPEMVKFVLEVAEDGSYELFKVNPTNGDFAFSKNEGLSYNENITLTINPNTGYVVDKVLVDGKELYAANDAYSFAVTFNSSVEVIFVEEGQVIVPETLTIAQAIAKAPSAGTEKYYANGYVVKVDNNYYLTDGTDRIQIYGDNTAASQNLYHDVKLTGVLATYNGNPEFKDFILEDLGAHEFDIIVNSEIANGSVAVSAAKAIYGAEIEITAIANDGYKLNKVFVNGKELAPIDGRYLVTIENNITVDASFILDSITPVIYNVSVDASITNGSVLVSKESGNANDIIVITVVADNGYKVEKVFVNDKVIEAIDGVYSFELLENSIASATFIKDVTPVSSSYKIDTAIGSVTYDKYVGSYKTEFKATTDGFTVTMAHINNYKADTPWDHLRAGMGNTASTAEIITRLITEKVTVVSINFTQIGSSGFKSLKVYSSVDGENWVELGDMTCAVGKQSFVISNPTENLYYKIALDLDPTGSNGTFRFNLVEFEYIEDVIPTHTLTRVEAKEPNCINEGNIEYFVCSECGKLFRDIDATIEIELADTILGKTDHSPLEPVQENVVGATCTTEGSFDRVIYCGVCGEELSREHVTGEKLAHTPSEAVQENIVNATCTTLGSYDEVVYCSVCGQEISRVAKTIEKLAHTTSEAVKENVVEATCEVAESYDLVVYCSVCHNEISREHVVGEKLDHTYQHVEAKEPTETEDGNIEYWVCEVCNKVFIKDNEEYVEVELKDVIIPKLSIEQGTYVFDSNKASYDKVVNSYTSQFVATTDGFVLTIIHANNVTNNGYTDVRIGRKNDASVASIITDLIEEKVTVVSINFTQIGSSGFKSLKVYSSVDGENWIELGDMTCVVGKQSFVISNPTENLYYKIAFDLDSTGSNGAFRFNLVEFEYIKDVTPTHALTRVEAKEPNCINEGNIEYFVCSECGKLFRDIDATIEIELADTILGKTDHSPLEVVQENIVGATCTTEGSFDRVIYCGVCGEELSREHVTGEKLAHTPSEAVQENIVNATCTSLGSYDEVVYCSVCGQEISRVAKTIEKLAHTYQHVEAKQPTETEDGNIEYWVCEVCNKVFIKDNEEYVEVELKDVIIPKQTIEQGTYVFDSNKASYDKVVNSYTSQFVATTDGFVLTIVHANNVTSSGFTDVRIGRKSDPSVASIITNLIEEKVVSITINFNQFSTNGLNSVIIYVSSNGTDWDINTQIDISELAVGENQFDLENPDSDLYYKVEFDMKKTGANGSIRFTNITYAYDSAPAITHTMTHYEAHKATCSLDGNIEYYYCSDCEKYFSDAKGHHEISLEDTIIKALGHTEGEKVVDNRVLPTCLVVGSYDEIIYCSVCGEIISQRHVEVDKLSHKMDKHVEAIEPTCTEGGNLEYYHCSRCGLNYADEKGTIPLENVILEALGHNFTHVLATEPKCLEDGNIEYYYCERCEKYFSDELGQNEITKESTIIEQIGHTAKESVVENLVEPTNVINGGYDEVVYCLVCNEELSRTFVEIKADLNDYQIYNLEVKTSEDLANDWTITKYSDGWVSTAATMGIDLDDNQNLALLFNYWDNSTVFKFTTSYDTKLDYRNISFTAKGNGISNVKIQLQNSESGVYMTYDLGLLSDQFADYVISFKDNNWKINFANNNYTFEQIHNAGYFDGTEYDLVSMFDTISFITSGSTSNGATAKLFVSNLIFGAAIDETKTTYHEIADELKANVVLDFSDGKTGSSYNGDNWYYRSYKNNAWTEWQSVNALGTNSQMNAREVNGDKNINLVANGNTNQFMYTLTEDSLGYANYFSVRLSNHFGSSTTINVKISLELVGGNKVYVLGSANEFYALSRSDVKYPLILDLDLNNYNVKAIVFTVYARSNSYLYIDDVTLLYARPVHVHTLVETKANAPTCLSEGNIAYYTCSDCGKFFSDPEGEHEIEENSWILEALEHTLSQAVIENKVEATCTQDGSYDEVVYCSECNTELSREHKVIPASGHTLEKTEAISATCTEAGNDEYYTCSVCHKFFSDLEGQHEIEENSWIIAVLGHSAGQATIENKVEATCVLDGSYDEVVYCSECHTELSREHKVIPASGHTLVEHAAVEPTYTTVGNTLYYECSVCHKFFSDAGGEHEIEENSWIIPVAIEELSIEEAITKALALANKEVSELQYSVSGIVTKKYGTNTYYLANANNAIQLYISGYDYSSIAGKSVNLVGNLQNYNGTAEIVKFVPEILGDGKLSINFLETINGTVSLSVENSFNYNEMVPLVITPDDGYEVSVVKVDGVELYPNSENYSFNITFFSSVSVTFVEDGSVVLPTEVTVAQAIEAASSAGEEKYTTIGYVTKDGNKYYLTDETGTIQIYGNNAAADGLIYHNVKIIGKLQMYNTTPEYYEFILEDLGSIEFDISVEENIEHGSIGVSVTKAIYNQSITIEVMPDNGYKLSKITINGDIVSVENNTILCSGNMVIGAIFVEESIVVGVEISFDPKVDKPNNTDLEKRTYEKSNIVIQVSDGTLANGSEYRVYKNKTLSIIVPDGYVITKVEFTCTSSNPIGGFANADGLDKTTGVWTGRENYVEFVASNLQVRITYLVVTYEPESITPHEHTYVFVQETTPTCEYTGIKAHYICSGCGKLFVLENEVYVETTQAALTLPLASHTLLDPVIEDVTPSTCLEKGTYYENVYCAVCHKLITSTLNESPLLEHKFSAVAEVPATATTNGLKAHYICENNEDNNYYLLVDDKYVVVSYESLIIPSFNEFSITVSEDIVNGVIIPSKATASAGETITIDYEAYSGYGLYKVFVNDVEIEPINNVYSFVLEGNSVISALFYELKAGDLVVYDGTITTFDKNSSDYTSTIIATTQSGNQSFSMQISNANTNNGQWDYLKVGRKNNASIASAITLNPIEEKISKVTLTIDAITASKINSVKLYTSIDNTNWVEVGSFAKATGNQEVLIANPNSNLYYKVEFDCQSGSSNGLLQFSKIVLSYSELVIPVTHTHEAATFTYLWNEDHTICTATALCSCGEVVVTEVASTKNNQAYIVKLSDATCVAPEYSYAYASFTNNLFSAQEVSSFISGPKLSHNLVYYPSVASTCTEEGLKEYYECSVCKKLFSDELGQNEVSEEDLILPLASHDLIYVSAVSATCTTDGNKAYYECKVCHKIFEDASGTIELNVEDVYLLAIGHDLYATFVLTETISGDEIEYGARGYIWCRNNKWEDLPGDLECIVYEELINNGEYKNIVAMCEYEDKIFEAVLLTIKVNGGLTIEGSIDSFDEIVFEEYNESSLEQIKNNQDLLAYLEENSLSNNILGAISLSFLDDKGIEVQPNGFLTITFAIPSGVDGNFSIVHIHTNADNSVEYIVYSTDSNEHKLYVNDDNTVTFMVDKLSEFVFIHDHQITHVEANPSTCAKSGNIEYWYCPVCNKFFSDEALTKEISQGDIIVEKIEHTLGQPVQENVVGATCTSEGSYDEVVYCSVCGEELSRTSKTIEKLAHSPAEAVQENVVNATCTVAGSYDLVVYCSECHYEISREHIVGEKLAHTPAQPVAENVTNTNLNDGSYDEVIYCSECNQELSREQKVIKAALNSTLVYDVEGKTNSQLASDWTIDYYNESWAHSASATVKLGEDYHHDQSLLFNYSENSFAFRYSIEYPKTSGYNDYKGISFVGYGNGSSKLTIRLFNSENSVYMDYVIDTVSNGYATYNIAFKDSGWKINFNGKSYTFAQIKQAGVFSGTEYDFADYFDTIQLIFKGFSNTAATFIASNLKLDANIEDTTSIIENPSLHANYVLDFNDGTLDNKYKNPDWYNRYYGAQWTEWVNASIGNSNMNVKQVSGNKNVNVYADTMDRQYKYQPEGGIGLVNYFEMKLSNHWTSGNNTNIKVYLTTVTGQKVYVLGDANNFYLFAKDSANYYPLIIKQELSGLDIVNLTIAVKVAAGNQSYIYIDDVSFLDEVPYVEPTIANINLDFSDGTTGSSYSDTNWKYKVGDGNWGSASGQMNARALNNNKNVNLAVANSDGYFKFEPVGGIGLANHFAIKMGNYFSSSSTINLKIYLVLTDESVVYLAGGNEATVPFAKTSTQQYIPYDITLEETLNIKALVFYVRANSSSYLYIDDLIINNVAPHTHEFNNPVYTWSDDNTKVTATATCTCGEKLEETVNTTYSVINEASCTSLGNAKYTSDTFTNSLFSVQIKEIELSLIPHTLTSVSAKEATCIEDGNIAYYICNICNKYFEDEQALNELEEDQLIIKAFGHSYSEPVYVWGENYLSVTASRYCSVCQHYEEETVATTNQVTIIANCEHDGEIVYTSEEFVNSAFTQQVYHLTVEKLDHVYGDPTYTWNADYSECVAKLGCINCSYEIVSTSNIENSYLSIHVLEYATCDTPQYSYSIANFDNELFTMQESDPYVTGQALGHQLSYNEGQEATCYNEGLKPYYVCSVCHEGFSDAEGKNKVTYDDLYLPMNPHNLTKKEAREATCELDGNNEYYSCSMCGLFFSDDKGEHVIEQFSWVIPATGHSLIEHPGFEATCTSDGQELYYECSVCHKFFSTEDADSEILENSWIIKSYGHEYEFIPEVSPTCTHTGVSSHYECQLCHKLFIEIDNEFAEITLDDLLIQINPKNHVLSEPNEFGIYTCNECGLLFKCSEFDDVLASSVVTQINPSASFYDKYKGERTITVAESTAREYDVIIYTVFVADSSSKYQFQALKKDGTQGYLKIISDSITKISLNYNGDKLLDYITGYGENEVTGTFEADAEIELRDGFITLLNNNGYAAYLNSITVHSKALIEVLSDETIIANAKEELSQLYGFETTRLEEVDLLEKTNDGALLSYVITNDSQEVVEQIIRSNIDVNYTMVVTITSNNSSDTIEFTFKVYGHDTISIEEALGFELGFGQTTKEKYLISGEIIEKQEGSYTNYYLVNGENEIQVYGTNKVVEGKAHHAITLLANVTNYNGKFELVNSTLVLDLGYASRNISVTENTLGSVNVISSGLYNDTVNFTINPNQGYKVVKVLLNETELELTSNNEYSFTLLEDTIITVTYEEIPAKYIVAKNPTENGSVTWDLEDNSLNEVDPLTEVTIIVAPNKGYHLKSVKNGDEDFVLVAGENKITINSDLDLVVEFAKDYEIYSELTYSANDLEIANFVKLEVLKDDKEVSVISEENQIVLVKVAILEGYTSYFTLDKLFVNYKEVSYKENGLELDVTEDLIIEAVIKDLCGFSSSPENKTLNYTIADHVAENGWSKEEAIYNFNLDENISWVADKGTATVDTRYWNNDIRSYKGSSVGFEAKNNAKITSVKIVYSNGTLSGIASNTKVTYKDGVDSVSYAVTKNVYITAIEIEYTIVSEGSSNEKHTLITTYDWASDYSSATIKVTCSECDFEYVVKENVAATIEVVATANCINGGETKYTVEFENYKDTKTVYTNPTGHNFVINNASWSNDFEEVTLSYNCSNCEEKDAVKLNSTNYKENDLFDYELRARDALIRLNKENATDGVDALIASIEALVESYNNLEASVLVPSYAQLKEVYEAYRPSLLTKDAAKDIIINSAYSYFYKGSSIQYDMNNAYRNNIVRAEDISVNSKVFLDCSSFVNAIYYNAFGYNLFGLDAKNVRTDDMKNAVNNNNTGDDKLVIRYSNSALTTEQISEWLNPDFLEVGDLILYRHYDQTNNDAGGHIVIYLGLINDTPMFMHATGMSDTVDKANDEEQTIYVDKLDVLATNTEKDKGGNGRNRYLGTTINDSNDYVTFVAIIRPLNVIDLSTISENEFAKSALSITKTSSTKNLSGVSLGKEIKFTVSVTNNSNSAIKDITISDRVPEYTSYVSGQLSKTISSLGGGKTATLEFTVKVNEDVNNVGKTIVSEGALINGLRTNQIHLPIISSLKISTYINLDTLTFEGYEDSFKAINSAINDTYGYYLGSSSISGKDILTSIFAYSGSTRYFNENSPYLSMVPYSLIGGCNARINNNEKLSDLSMVSRLELGSINGGDIILAGEVVDSLLVVKAYPYFGGTLYDYDATTHKFAAIDDPQDFVYKFNFAPYGYFAVIRPAMAISDILTAKENETTLVRVDDNGNEIDTTTTIIENGYSDVTINNFLLKQFRLSEILHNNVISGRKVLASLNIENVKYYDASDDSLVDALPIDPSKTYYFTYTYTYSNGEKVELSSKEFGQFKFVAPLNSISKALQNCDEELNEGVYYTAVVAGIDYYGGKSDASSGYDYILADTADNSCLIALHTNTSGIDNFKFEVGDVVCFMIGASNHKYTSSTDLSIAKPYLSNSSIDNVYKIDHIDNYQIELDGAIDLSGYTLDQFKALLDSEIERNELMYKVFKFNYLNTHAAYYQSGDNYYLWVGDATKASDTYIVGSEGKTALRPLIRSNNLNLLSEEYRQLFSLATGYANNTNYPSYSFYAIYTGNGVDNNKYYSNFTILGDYMLDTTNIYLTSISFDEIVNDTYSIGTNQNWLNGLKVNVKLNNKEFTYDLGEENEGINVSGNVNYTVKGDYVLTVSVNLGINVNNLVTTKQYTIHISDPAEAVKNGFDALSSDVNCYDMSKTSGEVFGTINLPEKIGETDITYSIEPNSNVTLSNNTITYKYSESNYTIKIYCEYDIEGPGVHEIEVNVSKIPTMQDVFTMEGTKITGLTDLGKLIEVMVISDDVTEIVDDAF